MMTMKGNLMTELETALETLKQEMIADYERWQNASGPRTETKARMLDDYINGIEIHEGRKYIKISTASSSQRTVWGFVVKKDGGKFRAGDLLIPAGWAAPATNKARGNILDGGYEIRWTGPLYL